MDQDFVSVPSCRPDHDADALHGRRKRFQCAAGWGRADVPGVKQPGRAGTVGGLSRGETWNRAAKLPERQDGAVFGVACEISETTGSPGYCGWTVAKIRPADDERGLRPMID